MEKGLRKGLRRRKIQKMELLFIEYPKCSTCKKAKEYLDDHGITYTDRHIKEANPTIEELREFHQRSKLALKRFFNTSGILYREMGLKDRLTSMSEEEQLTILASDGMLVKRPLLIGENFVLLGFKETEWNEKLF